MLEVINQAVAPTGGTALVSARVNKSADDKYEPLTDVLELRASSAKVGPVRVGARRSETPCSMEVWCTRQGIVARLNGQLCKVRRDCVGKVFAKNEFRGTERR